MTVRTLFIIYPALSLEPFLRQENKEKLQMFGVASLKFYL